MDPTPYRNIVRVSKVTKNFQLGKVEVQALKGIDLEITAGDYISIMGPSGSGKSTLFNMIGGLDKPTSGKVFIDEVDIAQLDAYELAWLRCRKIGYIFQTFNIIPVMTALENVTLPMTFAGMNNDFAVEKGLELLKLVGLGDRFSHKPFELCPDLGLTLWNRLEPPTPNQHRMRPGIPCHLLCIDTLTGLICSEK